MKALRTKLHMMSQQSRRILVIFTVILVASLFTPLASSIYSGWFLLAHIAIYFIVLRVFHLALGAIWTDADDRLDEREKAFKHKIYRQSYRAIVVLAVFLMLAYTLLDQFFVTLVYDPSLLTARLIGGYLATVFVLPSLMLAWQMPDPITRDIGELQHETA